ncbi:hypothetical protein [Gimesia algae]|uniref:Uncharacterized protein n=1 Tax=Gimesia algae TaxID=2527971 RepID=A0A517VKI3_9PLAN|nr:hypothetical protein [Gimesia algae]QDT93487.1 hypothetical protein Pan161_51670 [Gimesia algae]
MLSRVFLLLSSFLYVPFTLFFGLFAFLIAILFLTQQEIFVDAEGVPLRPGNIDIQPMSEDMRELLELSGKTGWKKNPETKARVMELSNSIETRKTLPETTEKRPKAVPIVPRDLTPQIHHE